MTDHDDIDETEEVEIFDANALIVESKKKPFRFAFGDEVFEISPNVDMLAASQMSKGNLDGALRRMLGDEQYQRLEAVDEVFDEAVFEGVFEAYAKHAGVSAGKSRSSGGSSRSTAGRSKRTSRGTTKRR